MVTRRLRNIEAMRVGLELWCCVALAALAPLCLTDSLRPHCPHSAADRCRFEHEPRRGQFLYKISDQWVTVYFTDKRNFYLDCRKYEDLLHNPALPRFLSLVHIASVTFEHCRLLQNGSYADLLATLNITGFSDLSLVAVPSAGIITKEHLIGLTSLEKLHVKSGGNMTLARNALRNLSSLQELHLNSVLVPSSALASLPHTLQELHLMRAGLEQVHLTLPNLQRFYLQEVFPVTVNLSTVLKLERLNIDTPSTVVPEERLPPSLRDVSYSGWNDTLAAPLTRCTKLKRFSVTGIDNSTIFLPDAWLANCLKLTELSITGVPLRTLPAGLLSHATSLQTFTCTRCYLTELPPGFFDNTPQLMDVYLSFNEIKSLPRELFKYTHSLETLDLSHNQLTKAVVESLADVRSLYELKLNSNKNLTDLCDDHFGISEYSGLSSLVELIELNLDDTNIKRVCADWREWLLNLQLLSMDRIAFENLTFMDLQYYRDKPNSDVYLGIDGEFSLLYTRKDYEEVVNSTTLTSRWKASVTITGSLRCDCQTYWAALAFRSNKKHVPVKGLECGTVELSEVNVDTLSCDASTQCAPLDLPAHCTCTTRDDKDHGAIVIVTCERANLITLPRLPQGQYKWRLHLAYNNITTIEAADVADDIVELDLRNNTMKRINGEAAAKLARIPLQLAGNDQLECGCEAVEMLISLLGTTSLLQDVDDVKCAGGIMMKAAPLVPCALLAGPALAGLVVVLVTIVVVVGILAQPKIRQHIKTILIARGWLPPPPEPKDDCQRRFDVFVSFANEDEEFVVEQLARRLESGPTPYKLCMHYRDWAPGEWIPAQIAASVRSSRRTVAVVSQHYVRSAWSRAEFREAHGASLRDGVPRLVVVLLDDPDSLPLDPELNSYVRHNTYVRWGDAWFWEKLRQALSPPREPPPENSVTIATPLELREDVPAILPAPP